MEFSGSKESVWGPNATIMVATAPQRTAPELSNSLVYNPLRVNNRVAFGTLKATISNFRHDASKFHRIAPGMVCAPTAVNRYSVQCGSVVVDAANVDKSG